MKSPFVATLALVVLSALLAVLPVAAQEGEAPHRAIGLGFHDPEAPIGGRWWVSQTVGSWRKKDQDGPRHLAGQAPPS